MKDLLVGCNFLVIPCDWTLLAQVFIIISSQPWRNTKFHSETTGNPQVITGKQINKPNILSVSEKLYTGQMYK